MKSPLKYAVAVFYTFLLLVIFVRQRSAIESLHQRIAELQGRPIEEHRTGNEGATDLKNHLPGLVDALPHLRQCSPSSLLPLVVLPERRLTPVKLLIAVPTVPREKENYLEKTLRYLIERAAPEDVSSIRILVMLSHENGTVAAWTMETMQMLKEKFGEYIEDGLLQVIVMPPPFLPQNLRAIEPNLGDTKERMYWRTKQSLDFIYLLSYAQSSGLGEYYMQLEDDVEPIFNYTRNIFKAAVDERFEGWRELQFSSLGCIGKMYRAEEIPKIAIHISIHYATQPVDWIIEKYFISQICANDKKLEHCQQELQKRKPVVLPSLFQHIGLHSSLNGKINSMKESGSVKRPKR